MEVCKGTTATNKSDMGIPYADAISAVCSSRWHHLATMERGEHIGVGNAKVSALSRREFEPARNSCN